MANYDFLLWDIDGTVLDFLAAESAAIKDLFVQYGFGECNDEMAHAYSAINVRGWKALERGEVTRDNMLVARFAEFFELVGADASQAASFNADYQKALGQYVFFSQGAREMIDLARADHTQAAVTNGTVVAQRGKLAKSGLDQMLDHIFISEEVGANKPSGAFFNHVLTQLGVGDLSRVLIIGDSLTSDIAGGIGAGIHTCWYNPEKHQNDSGLSPTYTITSLFELQDIM